MREEIHVKPPAFACFINVPSTSVKHNPWLCLTFSSPYPLDSGRGAEDTKKDHLDSVIYELCTLAYAPGYPAGADRNSL
jgi:hypothetical protein